MSSLSERERGLVALAAALAGDCRPGGESFVAAAKKLGLGERELQDARRVVGRARKAFALRSAARRARSRKGCC